MTNQEYDEIQERLTNKLIKKNLLTNKEQEYNRGILAAKSIVKNVYSRDVIHLYRLKGENKMKKLIAILITALMVLTLAGCETQADRVSYNLSQEADNFNNVRQVTVINCLQGDVLFQMTGKIAITADTMDNQLEIVVEDENGKYKKHFIGLSDNVTYVVEDITSGDVSNYKYTLNFNPKMWLPYNVETIE